MTTEQTTVAYLDDHDEKLSYLARQIWDHPEPALEERFASKLLADELEAAGFTVEREVAQMPTAFVASWGSGAPIIGILGEYDALPGLSQRLATTHSPVQSGGPGHGCGHNLFGVASFGAALAVKEAMQERDIPGTIRFYGCPAEETLVGKTFMAKAGLFDDLDAAIAWHPGDSNVVWAGSSQAMNSFKVNFHGVTAHAAADPHNGRSALDGAMLMDIGVNYLREHIIPDARIHSVITHGGQAPNVVPAYAQIWYFVRAPRRDQVAAIYARVLDIAKGAALMSGTTYDIDFVTGCYDLLPNLALSKLLYEKMCEVGPISFTEEEQEFARGLQSTFAPGTVEASLAIAQRLVAQELDPAMAEVPLWGEVLRHSEVPITMPGSTEVGDVSQITPTGQVTTTCWPTGTPGHSWQITASSGSSIGAKGMLMAAKSMALAGIDLLTRPDVLAEAKAEFARRKKGVPYVTPIPEGTVPH
ncbi:amidohydrolase [Oscillochloris sp. ZM17-4]|uniref:amidohydrolase n=1 Tax=Oscillochloris sp. ZM17-4 TaxID=2866714 RepID=UPI001C72FBC6|nr:amidohydrolase [Oscillochloris sp. ZM17-4]MBX0329980.1 amidohydrolase [Oscillochloris sp. ZM17-4]